MKKVFIFPYNSLVLYDLVSRRGHKPLAIFDRVNERVRNRAVKSPPYNVTFEDPRKALRYCAVEVPSGVRGRVAVLAPMVEEADAAILMRDPEFSFGSSGCARANELIKHMVYQRKIPVLWVKHPRNPDEAKEFVKKVVDFLEELGK